MVGSIADDCGGDCVTVAVVAALGGLARAGSSAGLLLPTAADSTSRSELLGVPVGVLDLGVAGSMPSPLIWSLWCDDGGVGSGMGPKVGNRRLKVRRAVSEGKSGAETARLCPRVGGESG